ncbi:hypothetical protein MAP00_001740 [Monascus purpureus]|nr:hypothetical protein MAP00_001740 [Monascus purpureus]
MSIVGRDIYPSHLASRLKSLPYWGGLRASPDTHQRPARTVPACPTPANWRILTYPPRRCDGASGGCGRSPRPGRPPPPTGLLGLRSAKSLLPRAASRQGRHPAASALIPLRPAALHPRPIAAKLATSAHHPRPLDPQPRGSRGPGVPPPGRGPTAHPHRAPAPAAATTPRLCVAVSTGHPASPCRSRSAAPPPAVDGLARPAGGGPPFPHISSGHRQGRKWHIYVPGSKRVWEGMFLYGVVCARVIPSIQSGPPGQSQTPALSTLNEIEAAARQLVNILERGPAPHVAAARLLHAHVPAHQCANWHCSTVTTGHPPIASPANWQTLRGGPVPHTSRPVTRKCPDGMCSATSVGRQLALFDRHDRPSPYRLPRQLANVLRSGPAPHTSMPMFQAHQGANWRCSTVTTGRPIPGSLPRRQRPFLAVSANWQTGRTDIRAHTPMPFPTTSPPVPLQAPGAARPIDGEVVFPQI